MSGAAMQASNSVQPPLIFSASSSSPTTSAPAALRFVGLRALGEHDDALLLADAVRQHDRAADDLLGLRVVDAQPDRDLDRLIELRAVEALERLDRLGHRHRDLRLRFSPSARNRLDCFAMIVVVRVSGDQRSRAVCFWHLTSRHLRS